MALWRSGGSTSGVYLSPATASEFLDSDTGSCWSDSEFDDDFDDENVYGDQDRMSQSTNFSNNSDVSMVQTCMKLKLMDGHSINKDYSVLITFWNIAINV